MNRLRQLETFARAGWFARGVVYCLLGYIALSASGGPDAGPQGVFRQLFDMPGGPWLLIILAAGLALYGAYRLYSAAFDTEGQGGDAKGIAVRIGYVASGLAHFLLAWLAVKLAAGLDVAAEGGQEQAAAAMLLDLPLGGTLLGLVGLAFLAAAAHQASKAWTAKFLGDFKSSAPAGIKPLGQAGLAARAVVFAIIAYSLMRAGWFEEAGQVKGLGGAIENLAGEPAAYTLVAAGLLLFGVYSFVEAKWRRIRNEDVVARLKSAAS